MLPRGHANVWRPGPGNRLVICTFMGDGNYPPGVNYQVEVVTGLWLAVTSCRVFAPGQRSNLIFR